ADSQFSVDRTLALAALIHALSRMEAEVAPPPYQSREAIEEACYQATRYGLDAQLPDDAGCRRPARQLVCEVLERARPFARELGCDAWLVGIERILIEGDGASMQRAIHRQYGMSGL